MREGFRIIHPVALALYFGVSCLGIVAAHQVGAATPPVRHEVTFDLVAYQVDVNGDLQHQVTDTGMTLDDCAAVISSSPHLLGFALVTCAPQGTVP